LFVKVFHPNLELSSKRLELAFYLKPPLNFLKKDNF